MEASIPWELLGIDPVDQSLLGFEAIFQWGRSSDSLIWTWNMDVPVNGKDPSRYGLIRLSEDPNHLPNDLPTIRIARPFEEEVYAAGDPVSVIIYSGDQDQGDVARVEVFLNDTLTGVDTSGNARSVIALPVLAEGKYSISATVRDHHGEFDVAGEVTFYVEAPAGGTTISDTRPLVRLFPNPASALVKFDFGSSAGEGAVVYLMDASGKLLKEQYIPGSRGPLQWTFELDRSKLKPGLYMVHIIFPGSQGKAFESYRLVLE